MLTIEIMRILWPSGDSKVPGLIDGIILSAPSVFKKYGLTSILSVAHAMAQFSHECGAGTEMVENINYTAKRAAQVWPLQKNDKHPERHFANEDDCYHKCGSFAGDPDFPGKLIDLVYGTRMGNRLGTHDGRNFIGRGLAQTTGRNGYTALGAKTGLDVVNHPEIIIMPDTAIECGVADFVICGCLPFALKDDVDNVTLHLNGGHVGLEERIAWLIKWKVALVQDALNRLGTSPPLTVDGSVGPKTSYAVRAFAADHDLRSGGLFGIELCNAVDAALAAQRQNA